MPPASWSACRSLVTVASRGLQLKPSNSFDQLGIKGGGHPWPEEASIGAAWQDGLWQGLHPRAMGLASNRTSKGAGQRQQQHYPHRHAAWLPRRKSTAELRVGCAEI